MFCKRRMEQDFVTVDSYIVCSIQDLKQYSLLNPVYINVGKSQNFKDFFRDYPSSAYFYIFKITSITSSNIKNADTEILVTCTGLSDCKKSDTNGHQHNVLVIIHLGSINNWEQLVQTSSWVNIDLVDYQDAKESSNIPFSFFTQSLQDVAKFEFELRNNKKGTFDVRRGREKSPPGETLIEVIKPSYDSINW